ncbi:MAG: hypothetical protein KBG28_30745 [Kofleriaceae bacterium]|nr:hypothetical protein [Kofleriaceae bacterium]MBP6837888.1 hypothetical protein [Kofleriaceae bacterium]MBP9208387.1 hypothetical protein [Kofleriaceae bacterium]
MVAIVVAFILGPEALERGPCLDQRPVDILDRRQAVAASVLAPALELLERVVAMLARLAGA